MKLHALAVLPVHQPFFVRARDIQLRREVHPDELEEIVRRLGLRQGSEILLSMGVIAISDTFRTSRSKQHAMEALSKARAGTPEHNVYEKLRLLDERIASERSTVFSLPEQIILQVCGFLDEQGNVLPEVLTLTEKIAKERSDARESYEDVANMSAALTTKLLALLKGPRALKQAIFSKDEIILLRQKGLLDQNGKLKNDDIDALRRVFRACAKTARRARREECNINFGGKVLSAPKNEDTQKGFSASEINERLGKVRERTQGKIFRILFQEESPKFTAGEYLALFDLHLLADDGQTFIPDLKVRGMLAEQANTRMTEGIAPS